MNRAHKLAVRSQGLAIARGYCCSGREFIFTFCCFDDLTLLDFRGRSWRVEEGDYWVDFPLSLVYQGQLLLRRGLSSSNFCAPASGPQLNRITPSESSEPAVDKPQPRINLDRPRCSKPISSGSCYCPTPHIPSDYTLTCHGSGEGGRIRGGRQEKGST